MSYFTGHSRPLDKVGLAPRQYTEWNEVRCTLSLLEFSHSRGCYLKFAVLLVQRVCSPKRPKTKDPGLCALVAYIAGDTSRHQPMGVGHVTVLQLCGPMGFHVLQWCHPMLACAKRTSCCTRIITLYGAWKVDSGPCSQIVDEIGLYSGYSEGRKTAIDLFTITINRELLFKTNTMLTDVNHLCHDVNAICVECDQVIEKLDELKITLGNFKRLTSYHVEEENIV